MKKARSLNLAELKPEQLAHLPQAQFEELFRTALSVSQEDRRQNQILWYTPTSPKVQQIHDSKAKVLGVGGGNGSGKSESMIVDGIMTATGVFPYSQRHLIEQKFRGPDLRAPGR
jgi:hypothetical protein